MQSIPLLSDQGLPGKSLKELESILPAEEFKKIILNIKRHSFALKHQDWLPQIDTWALESFWNTILYGPSFISPLGFLDAIKSWADLERTDFTTDAARLFFEEAIQYGDRETVEKMVAGGVDLDGEEDSEVPSPLIIAILYQKFDIAEFLLSKEATLKKKECDLSLLIGLFKGDAAMGCLRKDEEGRLNLFTKILLRLPLEISAKTTLAYCAFLKGYIKKQQYALIASLLLKMPIGIRWLLLTDCMNKCSMGSLEALLDLGVCEKEMFCKAASSGKEEVLEQLLQRGININATILVDEKDGRFFTALIAATRSDHYKIVQMLLERGADPNCPGGSLPAALHARSPECAELLKKSEIKRLSDYVFSLLLFAHHFQIRHKAEDPRLNGIELEGTLGYRYQEGVLLPTSYLVGQASLDDFIDLYSNDVSSDVGNPTLLSLKQISQQLALSPEALIDCYREGKGIAISTDWEGHSTEMWVEGDLVMHCNPTGNGLVDRPPGIIVYSMPDPLKMTPEVVQRLRGSDKGYILQGIVKELDLKTVGFIESKNQKGGFCGIRSQLLLFWAIMIAKAMKEQGLDLDSASEATKGDYRKTKTAVADLQLKRLLDFYEQEKSPFQPEISLLLMALARAPEKTEQVERLLAFLKKAECRVDLSIQGGNIFHYLKGREQLTWMAELFGKEELEEAIPSLLKEMEHCDLQLTGLVVTPLLLAIEEKRLDYVNRS